MEFNTNQINIMLDALEHYGNGPQVDMAIEEMSELTKELLKDRRGKENRSDIAMEMADVYIMLEQLKFIFGIDETELKVNAELKIQRLKNRIGGRMKDLYLTLPHGLTAKDGKMKSVQFLKTIQMMIMNG